MKPLILYVHLPNNEHNKSVATRGSQKESYRYINKTMYKTKFKQFYFLIHDIVTQTIQAFVVL